MRILVENKLDGFEWNFITVYGPAQQDGKENFLREFAHLCSSVKHPTVLGGRF